MTKRVPNGERLRFNWNCILQRAEFQRHDIGVFGTIVACQGGRRANMTFLFRAGFYVRSNNIGAFSKCHIRARHHRTRRRIASIRVGLFYRPLYVVVRVFAIRVDRRLTAFVIHNFHFQHNGTTVDVFLIGGRLRPNVIRHNFYARRRSIQNVGCFAFIRRVVANDKFNGAHFAFFHTNGGGVPQLKINTK